MKNLSWYILLAILLVSINEPKKILGIQSDVLMGFSSYVLNDLPPSENIEGCRCGGSKVIRSADGIFSRPCQCSPNCQCKKEEQQGSALKSDDCDIIKSMTQPNSPYRKFLPKQTGKELWCLTTSENWCQACNSLKYEFSKMKRTGWTFDENGDLTTVGNFHIRLIDFEKFEGFPSYFFEVEKDKDGNVIMDKEGQSKESLSLPTLVYFEDGKVKTVHVGFLNSYGMLKLFEGKPIIKGTDDIPTK